MLWSMVTMNIVPAKSHLSELIAAADAGEEVIITRHGVPVVRLVPVSKDVYPLGRMPKRSAIRPMSDAEMLEPAVPDSDWDALK